MLRDHVNSNQTILKHTLEVSLSTSVHYCIPILMGGNIDDFDEFWLDYHCQKNSFAKTKSSVNFPSIKILCYTVTDFQPGI